MSSSQSIYPASLGGSRPYEVIPSVRYSSADDNSTCEIVAASDTLRSLPSDRCQLKEMAEANKKLRCRSKWLLGILIAMVALLVVTGIPVYMKMEPWIKMVLRDIFGQGPASEAQPISGLRACGHGGGGSIGECAKVINQMYRDQHTRLKQDETADDAMDTDIQNVYRRLQNDAEERVIYRWRATAHVVFDKSMPKDDNGPLQWKEDIQGAPLRNFALDATSLRVEVSGYYYIYSHVTFNVENQTTRPTLSIFKQPRSGAQKKLLESIHILENTDRSSFVAGIFLLRVNDTLFVHAPTDLISRKHEEQSKSYFGAYQL